MDVLLVEDDRQDARMVQIALSRQTAAGIIVTHVSSLREALLALDKTAFDVVLLDLNLPDANGSEAVEQLMLARSATPIVVLSGNNDEDFATRLIGAGAQDYLVKGGDGFRSLGRTLRFAIERKTAEQRLKHLASYDTLTNLANRQELYNQLAKACAHSERQGDMVALLLLDLDRFKLANDVHGHQIGDKILRTVGERLETSIRAGDTAARLGGDEFAVVLEGISHAGAARAWSVNALKKLNRPVVIEGLNHPIAASVGVALYPTHGKDVDSLMRCADIAMYKVKHSGRNGVAFFDENMDKRLVRRQTLETEIRSALSNGEIRAVFQPKVSLDSGAVIGFEALCRWVRPDGDTVSPSEFIPIAQLHRLMPAVGRQVRKATIDAIKHWQDKFDAALPVSINVDVQELHTSNYATLLAKDLRDADLDASLLRIEITETTLLEKTTTTVGNLEALRKLGIGIELDDFGAGHSSLNYLNQFHVDTIKLDRSLLEDIASNRQRAVIVQTIIGLGRELGINVLAEGIETRLQLNALVKMGCKSGQGYLFARPMKLEKCDEWLASQAERLPEKLVNMTGMFMQLEDPTAAFTEKTGSG